LAARRLIGAVEFPPFGGGAAGSENIAAFPPLEPTAQTLP
jgi:hypothetical protein